LPCCGTGPRRPLKLIGQPIVRIDGRFKVTGTARYAYERLDVVSDPAYRFVLGAGISKGRIAAMDVAKAKASPGVLAIVRSRARISDSGLGFSR